MATTIDYINAIEAPQLGTIYLTGGGYINYPFNNISRESAMGWEEPVWGGELTRSKAFSLENIDDVDYGLVARCEISCKYMNIKDYKVLCTIAKQRVCKATYFNREKGEWVYNQEMAFTKNEVSKLMKIGSQYVGVMDASISLVATNRDRSSTISATHTVTYNSNGGTGTIASQSAKWANMVTLANSGFTKTGSTFLGWNTQANGYGYEYKKGQDTTLFNNLTLYAQWETTATLFAGSTLNGYFESPYGVEKIVFDNFTGENEYAPDGINLIYGLTRERYLDSENKVSMYRSSDNKEIYILSDKNCKIYANSDSSLTFNELNKLTKIVFNNFYTDNVTDMTGMFYICPSLTDFDLSNFNTSNVTSMSYMFQEIPKLKSLDLSSFDTSNVTSMRQMFSGCSGLTGTFGVNGTAIEISSNFDTSNVTSMNSMFINCSGLTSIDLSSFDTSNVVETENMFSGCSSLTNIDLSSFDTTKVTYMTRMFKNCSRLTTLDLSSFNTSNVQGMIDMFYECYNLATIYASQNFNTSKAYDSREMFKDCFNLVGGNGTTYNSDYIDKTYARIDTVLQAGYFTSKESSNSGNQSSF